MRRRQRLRNARPGLYVMESGTLLCKTEYGDNEGNQDIFIVSSGERYCGDHSGGLDAMVRDVTDVCLNIAASRVSP